MKKLSCILFSLILFSVAASAQRMLVLPDTTMFASQNKGVWILRLLDNTPWYSNGKRWVQSTSGLGTQTIADSLSAFANRIVNTFNGKKGNVLGVDSLYLNASNDSLIYRIGSLKKAIYFPAKDSSSALLGLIHLHSFTNTINYTLSGFSTAVLNGGKLNIAASKNSYTAVLKYSYASLLERWNQLGKFKIQSIVSGGGIGIGTSSLNVIDPSNAVGKLITEGANTRLVISSGYSNDSLATLTVPAATNGDSIHLGFERIVDTLSLVYRNVTAGSTYILKYGLKGTVNVAPNTGNYAIYDFGGSFDLYSHFISSDEIVGSTLLLVGDSKTASTGVTSYRNRYGELLSKIFPSTVISSGGADKSTEVLLRMAELIALKPKQVILSIGSNDVRNGMTEAQYEANIISITNQFTAAGTKVYHAYYYEAGTETFQPAQVAFLKATYPLTYMATYEALKADPTSITNSHPNDYGNRIIYDAILKEYKLSGGVSYFPQSQKSATGENGITSTGSALALGGTLSADTKIDLSNKFLWFKSPFKGTENYTKNGTVFIGEDTTVLKLVVPPGGIDHQRNAALIIGKTQASGNENVPLFGMSTTDAPSKNGWLFMNYTNVLGEVMPTMETYGIADGTGAEAGYKHTAYSKENGFLLRTANYDSLNLAGKSATPLNAASFLFKVINGATIKFVIDGNGVVSTDGTNLNTGKILAPNGTAGLPAFSFQNNLSTGISAFNSTGTADEIMVSSNTGGAVMRVTNTNPGGYSAIEYADQTGAPQVATGYYNGDPGEFRFNNIQATNPRINFKIQGVDKLQLNSTGSVFTGNIKIMGVTSSLLKTNSTNDVVAAVAGVDYGVGHAINTTTVSLSSAALNSAYPNVPVGYRVICGDISPSEPTPRIYVKYTENGSADKWLATYADVVL